jgi:hypothetical protein
VGRPWRRRLPEEDNSRVGGRLGDLGQCAQMCSPADEFTCKMRPKHHLEDVLRKLFQEFNFLRIE